MIDALPFVDAAMKYLIVPAVIWVWALHKGQSAMSTDIAVLKAEAIARDLARKDEREATAKQLDQILIGINQVNSRIDTLMKGQ
jgi:hypothetical protein